MRSNVARQTLTAILTCLAALPACHPPPATGPSGATANIPASDHPSIATIVRDGDPNAALAAAVWTAGIDPGNDAEVAAALFGLVEARLAREGLEADLALGRDGYRLRVRMSRQSTPDAVLDSVRRALVEPVSKAHQDDVLRAQEKVKALRNRPLPDPAFAVIAECEDAPFGRPKSSETDEPLPGPGTIEQWREAAHTVQRVALSAVGQESAVAKVVARATHPSSAWPSGAAATAPVAYAGPRLSVYPLSAYRGEQLERREVVRVSVIVNASQARALVAARALSDPLGPLALRLSSSDLHATLHEVKTTDRPGLTCLAASVSVTQTGRRRPTLAEVAELTALVRQEAELALGDPLARGSADPLSLARQEPDAAFAAERAAFWTLLTRIPAAPGTRPIYSSALGVGAGFLDTPKESGEALLATLTKELDRATVASQSQRIEANTRVEKGQGELWLLVGSPCGVAGEDATTAGASAAVVLAAAQQGLARGRSGVQIEPWVSADGVGLVGHAAALAGETEDALARRVADAVARPFIVEALESAHIKRAEEELVLLSDAPDGVLSGAIARALSPSRPSLLSPESPPQRSFALSDSIVVLRAKALRSGPLRVAVIGNENEQQAREAVRAAERWLPHGSADRTCDAPAVSAPPPRESAGAMLAVQLPQGAGSVGIVAATIPAGDVVGSAYASVFAALFNTHDGPLARALLGPKLARRARAAVIGSPSRGGAFVVRVDADGAQLDAAMVQTRALLDRIGRVGVTEEELASAAMAEQRERDAKDVSPLGRLIALFLGAPGATKNAPLSLEAANRVATKIFTDDNLVLVSGRPRP